MKRGSIYRLTFPNGKCYIGMTSVSVKSRIVNHEMKSAVEFPKLLVHKAWKKYGAPDVDVLAIVCVDDLASTEVRAIKAFGSFGPGGYNMTPGGEASPMLVPDIAEKVRALALTPERIARNIEVHLGSKRSDATRAEMSRVRKGMRAGIPKSPEHRCKISEANKGKYYLPPGQKHSEESKLKMADAARRRWSDPDVRQKMLNAVKTRKLTDETRAKLSAAGKKRHAKC